MLVRLRRPKAGLGEGSKHGIRVAEVVIMVMFAVPLLALLAAQAEAADIAAPNNCQFTQPVPDGGLYLLPTRFEALIPSNTSLWLREAVGHPHDYRVTDQTADRVVETEVTRIGLFDSVLVRLDPKVDLERNHRITIINELDPLALLATFTVNMGVDVVAPAVPDTTIVPASQAFQPVCSQSGYEVRTTESLEPRLLIVKEQGEEIAASTVSNFFVLASDGLPKSVQVVAVDLAGNYSDASFAASVTPDYPPIATRKQSTSVGLGACTCTRTGGPSLLALSLLGLFSFFFLRK